MGRRLLLPVLALLFASFLLLVALFAPIHSPGIPHLQPASQGWQDASAGLAPYTLINALAIDSSNSSKIYVASYDSAGFYRSLDGGRSWQTAKQGPDGYAAYAVALVPGRPESILLGTVGGIYRSDDAGERWRRIWPAQAEGSKSSADLQHLSVYALVFDPRDSRTIYAGRYGSIMASSDGGQTWQTYPTTIPAGLVQPTFLGLAFRPDGGILYAATSGAGILASSDGGRSWQQSYITRYVVSSIAVAPDGQVIARAEGQLLRSSDGGNTWSVPVQENFGSLALVEQDSSYIIYAGKRQGGLLQSRDGGTSWQPAGLDERSVIALAGVAGRIYAATTSGIWSGNGSDWQATAAGIGRPLVRSLYIGPNGTLDGTVYVATSDGLYTGTPGKWHPLSASMRDKIVLDTGGIGQTLFMSIWGGGLFRSIDGGVSWQNILREQFTGAQIPRILLDPDHLNLIYARVEYDRIIVTNDGGATWQPYDAGLEGVTVFSLTRDPQQPEVLFAGTDRGVYRNAGGRWEWLTTGAPFEQGTVFALEIDPQNSSHILAGATNGILISHDGGNSWSAPTGAAPNPTIAALLIDPQNPRRIWAGGRYSGVFASSDGGESWQLLGPPLPPDTITGSTGVTVNALALAPDGKLLYVGTDSGLWTLEVGDGR